MEKEQCPIIILGAARSGTTVLGKAFREHPDVLYVEEPKYVWKHGYGYLGHDVLRAYHANKKQKDYIRNYFKRMLVLSGKKILVEKSPSNCLRIEYIHSIYPNAKYIHIIRDGRNVALSAFKKSTGNIEQISSAMIPNKTNRFKDIFATIKRKLNQGGMTFLDFIYTFPHFTNSLLNMLNIKKYKLWGPRFIGMRDAVKIYSQIEIAGLQWKYSVETVKNYIDTTHINCLEVKYEDILRNPNEEISKIFHYVGLEVTPEVEEYIIKNYSMTNSHQSINNSEVKNIEILKLEKLIYNTLKIYGYTSNEKES